MKTIDNFKQQIVIKKKNYNKTLKMKKKEIRNKNNKK